MRRNGRKGCYPLQSQVGDALERKQWGMLRSMDTWREANGIWTHFSEMLKGLFCSFHLLKCNGTVVSLVRSWNWQEEERCQLWYLVTYHRYGLTPLRRGGPSRESCCSWTRAWEKEPCIQFTRVLPRQIIRVQFSLAFLFGVRTKTRQAYCIASSHFALLAVHFVFGPTTFHPPSIHFEGRDINVYKALDH